MQSVKFGSEMLLSMLLLCISSVLNAAAFEHAVRQRPLYIFDAFETLRE